MIIYIYIYISVEELENRLKEMPWLKGAGKDIFEHINYEQVVFRAIANLSPSFHKC